MFRLFDSSITLAELLHGAEKSMRKERNLNVVEDFVSRVEVLEYGTKAAAHYGDIRAKLESKGETIGVNDLHIAGHTRSEGKDLKLFTLRSKRANRHNEVLGIKRASSGKRIRD